MGDLQEVKLKKQIKNLKVKQQQQQQQQLAKNSVATQSEKTEST